jgi:hypothetical protein
MTIEQHAPFDAALVDVAPAIPWWMPAEEPGPDWRLWLSGQFPHAVDKALIEKEEPDVR